MSCKVVRLLFLGVVVVFNAPFSYAQNSNTWSCRAARIDLLKSQQNDLSPKKTTGSKLKSTILSLFQHYDKSGEPLEDECETIEVMSGYSPRNANPAEAYDGWFPKELLWVWENDKKFELNMDDPGKFQEQGNPKRVWLPDEQFHKILADHTNPSPEITIITKIINNVNQNDVDQERLFVCYYSCDQTGVDNQERIAVNTDKDR